MTASRALRAVLLSLCLLVPLAAQPDPTLAVDAVQTPELLSVGLPRLAQALGRYPRLQATITLLDAQRRPLQTATVDFSQAEARPYAVLPKPAGLATVAVKLTHDDRTLAERSVTPAALAPRATLPTAGTATTMLGQAERGGLPSAPTVALPDYARLAAASLAAAPQTIDLATTYRPIEADLNYPIAASRNNSVIGRQSAHPDDPAAKSLYISLRSQRFDPVAGAYLSDSKYLVELPLDKDWLAPLLQAKGRQTGVVPTDRVRVHATDKKVTIGGDKATLTGDDTGGLMQGTRGATVDGQGNLYFAMQQRSPVRLNIRTGEWEECPVSVYAFAQQFLPADVKAAYNPDQVTAQRLDFVTHVHYHNNRIYVTFARDAIFGKELFLGAIVSLPTTDWDNPEKFREQMRFIGGSWASAQPSFWGTPVKPGQMNRRLFNLYGQGDRLVLLSYHLNYIWAVDLNPDGSTKKLTRIETLLRQPVEKFSLDRQWLQDGQPLGVEVTATLPNGTNQTAFLPYNGFELTTTIPKADRVGLALPGLIRGEEQYGFTSLEKYYFARQLGLPTEGLDTEPVEVFYDALTPMQREPDKYRFILDYIRGTSLAPSYTTVAIPGQPNQVIGVGEYGYYQARLDLQGDGPVKKTFLPLDLADRQANLATTIGLGPYDHLWRREGNQLWLYYVGYTGVSRMLYSVDGQPVSKFDMDAFRGKLPIKQVDSPAGDFKWYHEVAPGLDGKLLTTGVSQLSRGGTPYSNGLIWFDPLHGDGQYKLSALSRGHTTEQLDSRVIYTAKGPEQEIYLGATFQPGYQELLPEAERPRSRADKLLVYHNRSGEAVRDAYGLDVTGEAGPRYVEHAFSPDQLHLLVLTRDADAAYLTSYDPTAGAYRDGVKLPRLLFTRNRPDDWLLRTPDGRLLLGVFDLPDQSVATFYQVNVAPTGKLSLAPLVTLTNAQSLKVASTQAFVANATGGYDLVLGGPTQASMLETKVRVVRDFLPAIK